MTIPGPGKTEYRFFWWWDAAHFASIEDARAAVGVHRQDPKIMARLRALLWRTSPPWQPEDEVAEEIAQLLSKGQLLTERLPFRPYWRREDAFWERNYARQFLWEFCRNPVVLDGLRSRFCTRDAALSRLTDAEIIGEVVELLRSGKLLVGYYSPPTGSFAGTSSASAQSDDSQVAPSPRATSSPADEEEPTFANHDGAAQAATLQKAADKGAPFCEQCSHGG